MTEIIFATGNKDKMREIREIMADCDVHIVSMKEAGIRVDIVEDGTTFEENAKIKARVVAAHTDAIVLADDSGLEIDALNKEPGVYSARYMGEDTSYDVKNKNLIDRLDGVPKEKRTARFVCAIAAVLPDGRELVTRQTMEGYIGWEPEGENGFGYDPIFYLDEYGCSSAAISPEQKNAISHRGKALRAMKELLKKPSFWGLLMKLKKYLKNSKKLLTLLPGYTIIYLASRMRHKQHGRNNIAFGVWLSLARAPGLGIPGGRRFESCHPDYMRV